MSQTRIEKIASISRGPLAEYIEHSALLGKSVLHRQLVDLLTIVNGFYAFEGALHVFPSGVPYSNSEYSLEAWNSGSLWRSVYGAMADGHLFFAEDVFGCQFSIGADGISTFDPETGQAQLVANDLEAWADLILKEYNQFTGYTLAHSWQSKYGALRSGQRLAPKLPFVLGGDFTVSNLFAVDALEGMRFRGDLAVQLKNLPDGATIQLKVVGEGSSDPRD